MFTSSLNVISLNAVFFHETFNSSLLVFIVHFKTCEFYKDTLVPHAHTELFNNCGIIEHSVEYV